MADGANPRVDIGVCLFLIVVCCAVLVEAAKLPPGSFEPLGSAPIPQATAGLIIFLCLLVIARAALTLWRGEEVIGEEAYPPRRLDATVIFGMTVIYVALMALRVAGWIWPQSWATVNLRAQILPVVRSTSTSATIATRVPLRWA